MKKWLSEELERIPCDFCGTSKVAKEFIRKDEMRVVECAQCGLAYLNPRPKPEFIPRFYEADYFTGVTAERGEGGLKCTIDYDALQLEAMQKTNPRPLAIINDKFGGFKGKDVLEIGCATGDFLVRIKNAGARVRGLEISNFAADIARKRGLDVSSGSLEDFVDINTKKFDIVIALEVIEHIQSPRSFFNHVARLVNPAGLLMISTPNYACVKRYGENWFGLMNSFEHIYYFDHHVLVELGMKSSFILEYSESSKFLGGPEGDNITFIKRQTEKLKALLHLSRQVGIFSASRAVYNRKDFFESPIGHTIIEVFCAHP